MKFILKMSRDGGCRLGSICDVSRLPGVVFETPILMLYTKGAAVPHLTHETLSMVSSQPQILEVPLQTTYQMEPGIKKQGLGIAKFSSMDEHMSYLSYTDPLAENQSGHFVKEEVPLWTKTGKKMFNADRYMDLVECYKPDMYHAICDGCVDKDEAKKRMIKAVDRTTSMFEICVQRHTKSEYLSKNSSLLGVISGSHSKEERERCLSGLLSSANEIHGFVLEGLTAGGAKTQNKPFSEIQDIIDSVTPKLAQDKIRLLHGCWNPVVILEAISRGWDVFDSTYPSLQAECGYALTFSFQKSSVRDFEINLKSAVYKEDFTPLVSGCECLCCRKHSRAYINHLLNTHEMLGPVLLMIHNLHHYMQFFVEIRQNISDGSLQQLIDAVTEQYHIHSDKLLSFDTAEDLKPSKRKRSSSS